MKQASSIPRFFSFSRLTRLLSGLSLAMLLWLLYVADLWSLMQSFSLDLLPALFGVSLLLVLGWFAPALAWTLLVFRLASPSVLSARRHLHIYGTSQIQRYLPGNVFHFLIRHLRAHREGEENEPLFWAALAEIIAQLIAASLLLGTLLGWYLAAPNGILVAATVALFIFLSLFGLRFLPLVLPPLIGALIRMLGTRASLWYQGIDLQRIGLHQNDLLAALPFYLLNIFILGLATFLLGSSISTISLSLFPLVLAVAAGAWIAGFLLPGAPGGLGPREAVLTAGLAPFLGLETTLFVAFALRLCSIVADLLYYLLSLICFRSDPAELSLDSSPDPK